VAGFRARARQHDGGGVVGRETRIRLAATSYLVGEGASIIPGRLAIGRPKAWWAVQGPARCYRVAARGASGPQSVAVPSALDDGVVDPMGRTIVQVRESHVPTPRVVTVEVR
jgi:hypothetical protein